jgi:hypothetical protein
MPWLRCNLADLAMKNLDTPIMDRARAQQQEFWDEFEIAKAADLPRWYTLRYWRYRFWCWRNGL